MHKLAATSLVPAQQCWTACWKQPSQCGSAGPAIGAVQQLSRRGDHHQCHALHCDGMALLSRRSALAVATLVSAPMLPQQEWSANAAADATAEAKKTCAQQLNPQTATAFFYALAEAVETQAGMPQQEFQQQAAALALRELRREAGAGLRAPVADISQPSSWSDPGTFNRIMYAAWKVAGERIIDSQGRTQLCKEAGQRLLTKVWPDGLTQAAAVRQSGGSGGRVQEQAALQLVAGMMQALRSDGYCCGWQITWGELPGGWPQDWFKSQPQLVGREASPDQPLPAGLEFQIRVHLPADIEGSVALRAEDDAFWSRSVSSMINALLMEAGVQASASEYFYQDEWQGPRTLQDQLLLALGDPLELVGIDFLPTTLVQDWLIK